MVLRDAFGRGLHYLRLSVTEACNFRCIYCLPNGFRRPAGAAAPLTVAEIGNLAAGFGALGFWKIRLTGGEPTMRPDIVPIAAAVAAAPGIRRVALTTNGHLFAPLARPLREAGVSALNFSLDSLDPGRFRAITGQDRLGEVLDGVEAALSSGFDAVKVNVVLMKGMNDADFDGFVDWTRRAPVSVRFIELMSTAQNQELFRRCHVPSARIRQRLLERGFVARLRRPGDGPAEEFEHPDHPGRVGVIAPYAKAFCAACNRLRVSSQGQLKLCLFGDRRHSLRPWLADPSQRDELTAAVRNLSAGKAAAHQLNEGIHGDTTTLSAIGG